jgi:hypothetical protein
MNDKNPELTPDIYLSGEGDKKQRWIDRKEVVDNREQYVKDVQALGIIVRKVVKEYEYGYRNKAKRKDVIHSHSGLEGDAKQIDELFFGGLPPNPTTHLKLQTITQETEGFGDIKINRNSDIVFRRPLAPQGQPGDEVITITLNETNGVFKKSLYGSKFKDFSDLNVFISHETTMDNNPKVMHQHTIRVDNDKMGPPDTHCSSAFFENIDVTKPDDYHRDVKKIKHPFDRVLKPSWIAEQILSAFPLPQAQTTELLGKIKI